MVEGIILAAGSSSRAGCFKMELPLGDKTLIERSIEGMYHVCSRIIVVGGYRIERIRRLLSPYQKIEVVENRYWQSGMFSSVKVGVQKITAEKFFILPGDIPLVPQKVYDELQNCDDDIVIPSFNERKGHPILLRHIMITHILAESDDSTLGKVIEKQRFTFLPVQYEEILLDVDSVDEYDDLLRRLSSTTHASVS